MIFCQRCCNWVSQPPPELQDGGISSHDGRMGLTRAGVPDPAIMRQGRMTLRAKVDEADHSARMGETPSLICRCNIGEMPRKVSVKCAIAGCHRRLKMTLAEREELRRVGRENNATAGLVCPAHVTAAFNSNSTILTLMSRSRNSWSRRPRKLPVGA